MSYSRRTFLATSGATAAVTALGTTASAASPPDSLRLPEMPLHDPYIVADHETSTYFLYTSNVESMTGVAGTGTMAYRSHNLRDWLPPRVVFLAAEQPGIWTTDGGWAPEVHEYQGKYYLLTTLHDESAKLPIPPPNEYGLPFQLPNYKRGTIVAVSDSLSGPFEIIDASGPTLPERFMTLDGTLYVDPDGQPWMVYAHEWLQRIDGTIEAIRLRPDLSGTIGDPSFLFKGSDAFWVSEQIPGGVPHQIGSYVTDGPQLYRTPSGALLMLWSTYQKDKAQPGGTLGGDYVQTYAVSRSGRLQGPWEQRRPLVRDDSGHGMLFSTFDGELMMVLHRPFDNARGKLYDVRFEGDSLRVLRQRTDLDGGG